MTPELKDAALAKDRAKAAADLARRNLKPDFVASAAYMNRGGLPLMWSAGVGVSVPLWAGKKQRPLIAEAEAARGGGFGDRSLLAAPDRGADRGKADPGRAARRRGEARRRRRARAGQAVRRRGARELSDRLGSVRHRARGARHVLHRPPRGGVAPCRLHPRRGRPQRVLLRPRGAHRDGVLTRSLLSAPPPGCRKDEHEITASHPSPPPRRFRRRPRAGRRPPTGMHAEGSGDRRGGEEIHVRDAPADHPRQARRLPDLRHEARADRSAPHARAGRTRHEVGARSTQDPPLPLAHEPCRDLARAEKRLDGDGLRARLRGRGPGCDGRPRGPGTRHDRRCEEAAPRSEDGLVRRGPVRNFDTDHGPGRGGRAACPPRSHELRRIRRARSTSTSPASTSARASRSRTCTAPDLFATQQEYLLASASRSLGTRAVLVGRAGRRTCWPPRASGCCSGTSRRPTSTAIEQNGAPIRALTVYAAISGYVTARTACHGMRVTPADTLFDIARPLARLGPRRRLRVRPAAPPVGQPATMTLPYWPGRVWNGTVTLRLPGRRREDAHGEGAHRVPQPGAAS